MATVKEVRAAERKLVLDQIKKAAASTYPVSLQMTAVQAEIKRLEEEKIK